MERLSVVLRDERTEGDSRYLVAKYSEDGDGDLLIEGQSLGEGVRSIFGFIDRIGD